MTDLLPTGEAFVVAMASKLHVHPIINDGFRVGRHLGRLLGAELMPDTKVAFSLDDEGWVCVWSLADNTIQIRFKAFPDGCAAKRLTAYTLGCQGKQLIAATDTGLVTFWNVHLSQNKRTFSTNLKTDIGFLCDFRSDSDEFVSVATHRSLRLWRTDRFTSRLLAMPEFAFEASDDITSVAFASKWKTLAVTSVDGQVYLCSSRNGAIEHVLRSSLPDYPHLMRDAPLVGIWLPCKNMYLTLCSDGRIRIWSVRDSLLIASVAANADGAAITSGMLDVDGHLLVTGDESGMVQIWYVHPMHDWNLAVPPETWLREQIRWKAHSSAIVSIRSFSKYNQVLTASADSTLALWTMTGQSVGYFGRAGSWHRELLDDAVDHGLALDVETHTDVEVVKPNGAQK